MLGVHKPVWLQAADIQLFSYVLLNYFLEFSITHLEGQKKKSAGNLQAIPIANGGKLAKFPTHSCHTTCEDTDVLLMTNSSSFSRKIAHKHYR